MAEPVLFWRDGFDRGLSGHFVRATSLNEVIPQWIDEGIPVAALLINPENGANIDVLIVRDEHDAS